MTVIAGVVTKDGVVIGADGMTSSCGVKFDSPGKVVERAVPCKRRMQNSFIIGRMRLASIVDRVFFLLAVVFALALSSSRSRAQTSPNTEKLAADTAELVAEANARRVLTAPLQGCLLDMKVCTTLDATFRSNLKQVIPSNEWITRETIASSLKNHGLLPLDAYSGLALRAVASEAGAELLVTEDLRRNSANALELVMQIFDAAHRKELGEFKVSFSLSDADDRPMVFKDPESGVSLVIDKGNPHWPEFVSCLVCPPVYLPERRDTAIHGLVDMLATVTERGTVDQIAVVKTFDEGITSELLKKIQGWRFRPAIDREGKPFAVRTHIQAEVALYPFKNVIPSSPAVWVLPRRVPSEGDGEVPWCLVTEVF